MRVIKRLVDFAVISVTVLMSGGIASAGLGQPTPWQLGLQQSASPVMDDIVWFHDLLPLRAMKGLLIALQYHHKAAEGRLVKGSDT
jgi:uncharacterized protein (DUF983 family)